MGFLRRWLGRIAGAIGWTASVASWVGITVSALLAAVFGAWAWATQWGYLPVALTVLGSFTASIWAYRGILSPSRAAAKAGADLVSALEDRVASVEAGLARAAGELQTALKGLAEEERAGAADLGRSVAALRDEVKGALADGGAERAVSARRIADLETVVNTRLDDRDALFDRHYHELRSRLDAVWRAAQAREAEFRLRSLNDEAAVLKERLLRADAADYATDGTPADFAAAWAQDFAVWRERLDWFWHLAGEWDRPYPDLFNPPASAFDQIHRPPPEALPRDMEHRWKTVAVVGHHHRIAAEEAINALQRVARGEGINPA